LEVLATPGARGQLVEHTINRWASVAPVGGRSSRAAPGGAAAVVIPQLYTRDLAGDSSDDRLASLEDAVDSCAQRALDLTS
jgi:hypothetical protein